MLIIQQNINIIYTSVQNAILQATDRKKNLKKVWSSITYYNTEKMFGSVQYKWIWFSWKGQWLDMKASGPKAPTCFPEQL